MYYGLVLFLYIYIYIYSNLETQFNLKYIYLEKFLESFILYGSQTFSINNFGFWYSIGVWIYFTIHIAIKAYIIF